MSKNYKEMSLQDLVKDAKAGNDYARRIAISRIIEAREVLTIKKFYRMRLIMGAKAIATLRETLVVCELSLAN